MGPTIVKYVVNVVKEDLDTMDIENPDRDRGIFSESDRLYLVDRENYATRQTRYNRKQEIPRRIRNAFLDLAILADPEFPEDLLDEAFRDPSGETVDVGEMVGAWEDREPAMREQPAADEAMQQGFVEAIALMNKLYTQTGATALVEEGTTTAVRRYYPELEVVDASYDPDIRPRGQAHDVAKHRLKEDLTLTDEQVRLLLEKGEIDPERVAKHVRDHRTGEE